MDTLKARFLPERTGVNFMENKTKNTYETTQGK
jgi:hypothetical protein